MRKEKEQKKRYGGKDKSGKRIEKKLIKERVRIIQKIQAEKKE